MLKPQDTLIAIKYWSIHRAGRWLPVRDVADQIGISAGEVSKGAHRLQAARILVSRADQWHAEQGALLEWLSYGVRYAYPVDAGGFGRGMPTAWNCPLVVSDLLPPSPPLVWSVPRGEMDGISIEPIHPAVPQAARLDDRLYQVMALVDAVRLGKPRELGIARNLLASLIKDEL